MTPQFCLSAAGEAAPRHPSGQPGQILPLPGTASAAGGAGASPPSRPCWGWAESSSRGEKGTADAAPRAGRRRRSGEGRSSGSFLPGIHLLRLPRPPRRGARAPPAPHSLARSRLPAHLAARTRSGPPRRPPLASYSGGAGRLGAGHRPPPNGRRRLTCPPALRRACRAGPRGGSREGRGVRPAALRDAPGSPGSGAASSGVGAAGTCGARSVRGERPCPWLGGEGRSGVTLRRVPSLRVRSGTGPWQSRDPLSHGVCHLSPRPARAGGQRSPSSPTARLHPPRARRSPRPLALPSRCSVTPCGWCDPQTGTSLVCACKPAEGLLWARTKSWRRPAGLWVTL